MNQRCVQLTKEAWELLSESAHLVVFGEKRKAESERVDFALIVDDVHEQVPLMYATCKELDSETLYLQYGGAFPGTKDTISVVKCFEEILKWAQNFGYLRVSFRVENDNHPMLKLAMRCGFKIVGLRAFKDSVLLEHLKEF